MSRVSPTLEGFRAAFRRPSLTLAEISWRWTVGGATTALFVFALLEYLDTLPVTGADILLLRTRQPILIGQALGHIFHGSMPRFVMALLAGAIALTFVWILAASVGRATTVRGLIDYFAERQQESGTDEQLAAPLNPKAVPRERARFLGALLRLNFLRAAVALAAILSLVGAVILVQMVAAGLASNGGATVASSTPPNPGAGLAFLLIFPLAALIFLAWSTLNWVLSLAGMFAVCGEGDARQDASGALSAAVAFCRERSRPVFAVGFWTGLAHLTVFVAATTVISVPLSFAQIVPGRIVLVALILVMIAYFALADWLYMARLAGYVCIVETPEALLAPPLPPVTLQVGPPVALLILPAQTTIDRDEPILSDVPGIVPAS